ncbi:MAG: ECF transporter S component [Bacillota bacterium]
MEKRSATRTAVVAMLVALNLVLTAFARIPAFGGKLYFHLGCIVIYTSAVLFGASIGALVGAVGSALADLVLGYPVWAPFSFVIHGIEGFVVGKLNQRSQTLAMSAGALVMIVGYALAVWVLYGIAGVPVEVAGDTLQGVLGVIGSTVVLRGLRSIKR